MIHGSMESNGKVSLMYSLLDGRLLRPRTHNVNVKCPVETNMPVTVHELSGTKRLAGWLNNSLTVR